MQPERFDVAVLGSGFAGSAAALLLLRRRPDLRVVMVERKDAFDRGVGESTVEVSGHFLRHVLGITKHLNERHLSKQGLRFWFHDGPDTPLTAASEIGPRQLARLPAWQLDRAALDEHVLSLAVAAGARVRRPARVRSVVLAEEAGAECHRIELEHDGGPAAVDARYLVDASGRSGVVARPRGWVKTLHEHPTAAVWARFDGVLDLDDPAAVGVCRADPFVTRCIAPRRLGTNHCTGHGYWIWAIPMANGETSLGAVWDTRHVQPVGSTPEAKLRWFLDGNPVSRALCAGATIVPGDIRGLGNLAYLVDRVAGPGWSMVGDAAGFLDPFYSPGLDQVGWSVCATVDLAVDYLERGPVPELVAEVAAHDVAYRRFFRHYFDGIYRDKYELLGDFDLMSASMLIDTGMYYLITVESTYRRGVPFYRVPPFYRDDRGVGRWLVSAYKNRLLALARRRVALGTYGKRNRGRRALFSGFALGWPARRMLLRGLGYWARAEAEHWLSYLWPRPRRCALPALPFAGAPAATCEAGGPVLEPAPPRRRDRPRDPTPTAGERR